MKRFRTWAGIALIALGALFVTGCPDRMNISKIQNDPAKYAGKEVVVAGTVKRSAGVSIPIINIGGGAYQIDDGTGTIWVLTERSVPVTGTRIGIKGRVQNGVVLNGRNYGLGIYENDRRTK